MIVASPWSRGGFVCSQVFDHTSVIQLMERVMSKRSGRSVREPNISAWRRAVCGDMASAFRRFDGGVEKSLVFPPKDAVLEGIHKAQFREMPGGFTSVFKPQQEKGTRPATALPYELFAEGVVSDGALRLTLTTGKGAGAGFHAYTPGTFRGAVRLRTRAYAVAGGSRVVDDWALAGFVDRRYDVRVHGPNGFYREFAGSAGDPRIEITCGYVGGDLELRVKAVDGCTLRVVDESYGGGSRVVSVKAGATRAVVLRLAKSLRWYDFSVAVDGASGFRRRFAGHVETGQAGSSDPAMGGGA
jgi:phospholipase C